MSKKSVNHVILMLKTVSAIMEVGRLHQNLSPLWMSEYLSLHSSINNMFAPLPVSDLFANPSYSMQHSDLWQV